MERKRRQGKINPHVAAPALTAVMLILAIVLGGFDIRRAPGRTAYLDRVAAAIEALPYRVGPWVGKELEEQLPEAQEMLKPNVMIQRRYQDVRTGDRFTLLLVHCGDVRDMQGHYPPNCYKGNGWVQRRAERVTIEADDERISALRYFFRRESVEGDVGLYIWNFFVLPRPGDPFAPDMSALHAAAGSTERSGLGSAQFQFLFAEGMDAKRQREVVETFVGATEGALETIARGIEG